MRKYKYVYWISTSILSFVLIMGGYSYISSPDLEAAFAHLGFPGYFRIELGICKIIAGILLILPMTNFMVRGFCYAGTAISFGSAIIAHTVVKDPLVAIMFPVFFLFLLGASFYTFLLLRELKDFKRAAPSS